MFSHIHLIPTLWHFSRSVQPKNALSDLGRRIEYVLRLLPWLPWIHPLINIFNRPKFKFILAAQPSVLNKTRYPYLNCHWGVLRRCTTIAHHYRWLLNNLHPEQIQAIYSPTGLTILDIQTPQRHYRVVLEYHHSCRKEGDLMLTILSSQAERLATLSIAVSKEDTDHVLIIGGMQGGRDQADALKQMAKDCHGLRPMALLVNITQALAHSWKISSIRAVSDQCHVYQHWLYRSRQALQVKRSYNQLWKELGGQPHQDWYLIPTALGIRNLQEVSSHKRAMYARRNQLLTDIQHDIDARFGTIAIYSDSTIS
ncbi:MAG: DUF535 family protein [Gammaproteobacteria bacterium]|nr:DUF535 family protein [Gammaproteobacteria bacterium]